MGYIFYRIVLLNGVNKNVYKKENSIKLYCRFNGKMIDIKKYKQLCKPPKKSKSKSKTKSKPKANAKAKPKANAKAKPKRKRQMKGGFLGLDKLYNLFFSGKSKNEKELEEARKKYEKLKTEGETICSDATKKTQEAQKEVFRLEVEVNHEKEQKRLKEKANETQNQEQQPQQMQEQQKPQEQEQSIAINRDSPLKNTSPTQPYVMKGGKAKKSKMVKKR